MKDLDSIMADFRNERNGRPTPPQKNYRLPLSAGDAFTFLEKEYSRLVAERGKIYRLDQPTQEHLSKVADYLTSPERKLSLMLCGTMGNGKTVMGLAIMGVCRQFRRGSFSGEYPDTFPWPYLVSASEIARLVTRAYDSAATARDLAIFEELQAEKLLIIDDLGQESSKTYSYGTDIMPLAEIIRSRHAKRFPTVITTNLTEPQIAERYKQLVLDRIHEQYEMVAFTQPSYRTQ